MRRLLAALLFVAVAAGARPASAGTNLDAQTTHYLEGVWLIGRAPPTGDCVSNSYVDYQFEFEFARTGGRLLSFEPYDLFGAASILAGSRTGDTIALTISAFPPVNAHKFSLKILGPDRMALTADMSTYPGPSKPHETDILYRCGRPDTAFSPGVPTDVLRVLTQPELAGNAFVEVEPGQTDLQACTPKRKNGFPEEPHWIRFEVFGPVHFFVMGSLGRTDEDIRKQLDLAPLRALRVTGPHSLQIEGLERLEGSQGWNGGTHAKPFIYDIDWSDNHIHIAQLDATFVDCGPVWAAATGQPPR